MATATRTKAKRAIGIVRVSQTKGREGDSFASPSVQRDRIEGVCEFQGLRLIDTADEMDVSGKLPISERTGLREAVERVEAGEADVIVAAYYDRLLRSVAVRTELVRRVEDAGGQVLTVDVGAISDATAGQWLSGTLLAAVNEFVVRQAAEKSREAQQRAIDRKIAPWPSVPPGYRRPVVGHKRDGRPEHGPYEPDPDTAPIVEAAYEMRAAGATIADVRAFLGEQGIERSYHGTQAILSQRAYLGEINFGDYEPNLTAHEPIVDADLWNAVQRVRSPRGRRAKSDRLLARLGVLTCASCGGRMTVGTQTQNGRSYPFYRCPKVRADCDARAVIGAKSIESVVVDAVQAALSDVEGRASVEANVRAADEAVERAQTDLDAALRLLADFDDEAAARDRLAELRQARDEALDRRDQLGAPAPALTVSASDWDRLTLGERRELIRATVSRVSVAPGRGTGRVAVELFTE